MARREAGPDPIIVTLQFDPITADFFDRQRRAHFPERLNRTPAHLTLFHNLPGEDVDAIMATIGQVAARTRPFPATVEGLMPLGRGVAYKVSAGALIALRAELAAPFRDVLIAQDRERFRPHVTVQNKVTPQEAKRTLAGLQASFVPFCATAEGLQLWYYRGGPWEPLAAVGFSA